MLIKFMPTPGLENLVNVLSGITTAPRAQVQQPEFTIVEIFVQRLLIIHVCESYKKRLEWQEWPRCLNR